MIVFFSEGGSKHVAGEKENKEAAPAKEIKEAAAPKVPVDPGCNIPAALDIVQLYKGDKVGPWNIIMKLGEGLFKLLLFFETMFYQIFSFQADLGRFIL